MTPLQTISPTRTALPHFNFQLSPDVLFFLLFFVINLWFFGFLGGFVEYGIENVGMQFPAAVSAIDSIFLVDGSAAVVTYLVAFGFHTLGLTFYLFFHLATMHGVSLAAYNARRHGNYGVT